MANEGELSKRIDDVHRRLDDIRGDMNTRFAELRADQLQLRQEMVAGFAQLRQEIAAGDGSIRQEIAGLRQEMGQWRVDLSRQSRLFLQLMGGGFGLPTLLVTLFRFL
jgi:hypothetical protein